jgi:hypothetical protein
MAKYTIEQKIVTLSEIYIDRADGQPEFEADGLLFGPWEYELSLGQVGYAWIVKYKTEADNVDTVYIDFHKKLRKIIPRMSLICQAYIQYVAQPLLITKEGSEIAFLYLPIDEGPVGLSFWDDEKKALDILMDNKNIPEEFFLYWNDAVNTADYSSKLLLMFAALESLAGKPGNKKRFELLDTILGEDLRGKIFGRNGLRHRLSHGEYFAKDGKDSKENYVKVIHEKIIKFFNDKIFKEELLPEDVVSPQRNFIDNKVLLRSFIAQQSNEWPLNLKKVIESSEKNRKSDGFPADYRWVHDKSETDDY